MTMVHAGLKSVFTQSSAVVFAGVNGLDFLELRLGTVRIPEVTLRLKEAQRVLDQQGCDRLDLNSAIVADDETFFKNTGIKSLLAAIVQVGLYDRMLRSQRPPQVLLGASNGDSALMVCAGVTPFEQLVLQSSAVQTLRPRLSLVNKLEAGDDASSSAPVSQVLGLLPVPGMQAPLEPLSVLHQNETGVFNKIEPKNEISSLTHLNSNEFRSFMRNEDGSFAEIGQVGMDLRKLISEVVEQHGVCRYINVGPAQAIPELEYHEIADAVGADEVTVIDSIDLDPMLNWFWKQMRSVAGIAQ